jgi:isopenicillin-N N-acyltransferase-like protein
MSQLIPMDLITVSGTTRSMGQQQGEALRERIRAFMQVRMSAVHQYARDRGRDSAAGIIEIGRQSMDIYAGWDPDGYDEHVGISEGAGVDPVDLYTATNMTDMRDALLLPGATPLADEEGCSALLVPGNRTKDGLAIVGQTWDLNPSDIEYVVAIHRRPDQGLETWAVTCSGCLTLMGINASGLTVGTTNIKTHGSKPGIGYLALLHRMVRTHSVKQAARLLLDAPRSGAHVFWLADPTELREYETSPSHVGLREPTTTAVCHTNHCIHSDNVEKQGEACSESSASRLTTMERLLDRTDVTVDVIKSIFADRSDGLNSINRYAEDGQGTATNAVFIATPAKRQAYACRGPADQGAWYELNFSREK